MEISDNIILQKIIIQNIYCDEKSREKYTGFLKRKYKLAGNIIKPLEVYTFFVSTTEKFACAINTTIEVGQQHWENKKSGYLTASRGYIDLRKVEVLSGAEICEKIKDKTNGFFAVARLCDRKYEELKNLGRNIKCKNISTEGIVLAGLAIGIFNTSLISDKILKNLGLD